MVEILRIVAINADLLVIKICLKSPLCTKKHGVKWKEVLAVLVQILTHMLNFEFVVWYEKSLDILNDLKGSF